MKEQNAGKSWIITALTAVGLVLVGWFGRELMPTFGGAARTGGCRGADGGGGEGREAGGQPG